METEEFRILIASTEKTGNTWLKLLLSNLYDLPAPYLGPDFSESEADMLGQRWVTHQHFFPERRLLEWADLKQARLLTTVRHPGDTLVSLYHYCCNYADHYKDDVRIERALVADAADRQATATLEHHVVDGELIRALQDRIMCDLNISISWILSRRSTIVRYEDLRAEPLSSLSRLAALVAPVSSDRIQQAIDACELKNLRDSYQIDSRFFRRALVGEWRSALPLEVLRRFHEEETFKAQFAFLGYDMEPEAPAHEPEPSFQTRSILQHGEACFDNGVPFLPILAQLLESVEPERREGWNPVLSTSSPDSFFHWVNAPADGDVLKHSAIPRITNLAAFIYTLRPDLQAAFPDIFDSSRLGYAGWFLRYAIEGYQLDRRLLTPVALSWIEKRPEEATMHDEAVGVGRRAGP